jgi:hypothetical protein
MLFDPSSEQKFDLAIAVGAFVSLYWILYIDPLTGELPGLALGSLPVLIGEVLSHGGLDIVGVRKGLNLST